MIRLSRFGSRYGERAIVYSNPGSPVKVEYIAQFDSNGALELVPNGERNIFQDIQMFKDECDIHLLLKRYAAGETDVLTKVQGFYADISQFPTTYAEMFNVMKRSREFFDTLPVDVKSKFGNSYETFLASSQSPDFLSAFVASTVAASPVKDTPKDDANES